MIRTSQLLQLIVIASFSTGAISTAAAQTHGLASSNFLQPEKSSKSLQPQILGLADKSHLIDKKAGAVTGLKSAEKSKSLELRNTTGSGVGQLKPLKNKINVNRHLGEGNWETIFDGITTKQEPSKGKLPSGESFLQDGSSLKETLRENTSHSLLTSPWSKLSKDAEGLK